MRFASWAALTLVVAVAAGCGSSLSHPVASPTNVPAVEPSVPKEPVAVAVDIKSWQEIQSWVASQRGKIVVVDIWSNS